MIKENIQDALNQQIAEETYSAYLYHSMEAYFQSINLTGFANWMRIQTMEELTHATKFFDFVNERGGRVKLLPIKQPDFEWDSPLAVFEAALKHEGYITECINKLVDLAIAESDHATNNFLQWFVAEQVEEEATADDIVQKLKLVGTGDGLFYLDQEMAKRVFVPPAAE